MQAIQLHAEPRTVIGKKVKLLRQEGIVPGVIYGHHLDSVVVQFDKLELTAALRQVGTSATLQVEVAGSQEPYLVIFRDIQHHVTDKTGSGDDFKLTATKSYRIDSGKRHFGFLIMAIMVGSPRTCRRSRRHKGR